MKAFLFTILILISSGSCAEDYIYMAPWNSVSSSPIAKEQGSSLSDDELNKQKRAIKAGQRQIQVKVMGFMGFDDKHIKNTN